LPCLDINENANENMSKTKKNHEIEKMLPFISDLCIKHDCEYVIDIGAGLGYFDRLLTKSCPHLTVIAIEKNEQFTAGALKLNKNNEQIITMSFTIDQFNYMDLIKQIKLNLNKSVDTHLRMGLISLHSCGDLTPNMLKLFSENQNDLKFMAAFSCCYQAMQPINNDDSSVIQAHDLKKEFFNFPMSQALKKFKFSLNLFGLRLACQQNM